MLVIGLLLSFSKLICHTHWFFWVLSKKSALEEVNNGAKKPIGPWFYFLGKYIYIPFAIAALVLGIKYGGIG